MSAAGLPPGFFKFLAELAKNNNRDWFQKNKGRFEGDVQGPALGLVEAIGDRMPAVSRHIVVEAKKAGGSLLRIYRDVRFSKDKSPYQTYIAAQFRHAKGKGISAPGFYVHLSPADSFLGVGIWQPEPPHLLKIRKAIESKTDAWLKARDDKGFRAAFAELAGESLKRPPVGFQPEHPCVEDLKRKDYVAFRKFSASEASRPGFPDWMIDSYRASTPFMRFLCSALEFPF
ncbi:MAG TPA: TIGR02453 family protein [Planctomycetota bacterium]|nr:TIGR02453 family protein [Planctomycetota bacterium]